jgi:hypothetical protein
MRHAILVAFTAAIVATSAGSAAGTGPLTFHRVGGAPIAFSGKTYVWCGPWEPGVSRRAVHVMRWPKQGRGSYWQLSGVLRDIRRDSRVRFPVGFVWNKPKGAQLFVYDSATRNEASSETEEARGTITFSEVTCRRGRSVTIRASGMLGSEFSDGTPLRVTGTFRGTVGRPPPGLTVSG